MAHKSQIKRPPLSLTELLCPLGNNCATDSTVVPLTVNIDSKITVGTVTPSSDVICPSKATGTVYFDVMINAAAASMAGQLLSSRDQAPVSGATSTPTPNGDKTHWRFECTGAPVGDYVLAVNATSAKGAGAGQWMCS